MSDQVYEVQFQERGKPKGPDYRFFSKINHALEFMAGITSETDVAEMTFRAHCIDPFPGGATNLLNAIASRLTSERDDSAIPF